MFYECFQLLSRLLFMALHTLNAGSFPQPLSEEEERRCMIAYKEQGDRDARARLIEHNLRLVAHIVKKYYYTSADPDDLISIGTIGLIKAVETFDPGKGSRLATYASRCIENEILMVLRAGRKSQGELSISEPVDTDKEGHPLTLLDMLAEEGTMLDDLEVRLNSRKLYRYIEEELDEREREIIVRRYGLAGEPMTQREVARRLKISRSYVSRIEKHALEKLYERFERGDPLLPRER